MNFLTIDFESANRYYYSPCSVAIYEFSNNVPKKLYSTLINPGEDVEFEYFCTRIHGIDKDMVSNAPTVDIVIKKICEIIKDKFIFAHNAYYDISKIIEGCEDYSIVLPNFEYADSLMVAKRTWKQLPNYRLDTVSDYLNFSFNHHNAEDDAIACGNIILEAAKYHNVNTIDELLSIIKYVKGYCLNNEWFHSYSKTLYNPNNPSDYDKIRLITINSNANSPITGMYFVFTGALNIPRSEAMKLCADRGAIPQASVTKETNYLVVGSDDYGKFKCR